MPSGDYIFVGHTGNRTGERGAPVQQNGSRERGQAENSRGGANSSA